jgi:hypothetical protein
MANELPQYFVEFRIIDASWHNHSLLLIDNRGYGFYPNNNSCFFDYFNGILGRMINPIEGAAKESYALLKIQLT